MDQGRSRWIGPALALAALSGGTGCGVGVTPLDPGGDRLVIASDLTAVECRALEVLGGAGPARWVRLRTGESVARLAEAGADVDVVIVATADAARRLEDRGVIEPGSTRAIARPPAGLAIQRSAIVARALPEPNGLADLDRPEYQGVIAWADPAIDAAARAISRRSLGDEDGWRVGYARLVRLAGRSRPVAPGP
jgi:hypothetical protein